jgi:5-methylcytosine-specific restriction protein A
MCDQPASVVDHIKPHRGDRKLFWERSNWQPLCQHHHSSTKQRMERTDV